MDEQEQLVETPDSNAAHAAAAEEHDQQADNHDDNVDPDSQEQAEEDEEVEIDGKKFALPKSAAQRLQSERLMQADYTRKTQEVADSRKALEAEREQAKQQAAQHQQYLDDVADVRAIDKQLKQYADLNWNQIIEQDPVQAMQLQQQQRALEAERSTKVQSITQKQGEQALAEQQATAKQIQEAEAYVQREIPGWTKERGQAVNDYIQAQGVKLDQAVAKVVFANPALVKLFDKAEKFDQLVAKQSAKPPKPAAPPAPVTRVSAARASAKVDPSKLSTSDWMAQRNKQVRG